MRKLVSLDNLSTLLGIFKTQFGSRDRSESTRQNINTYLLNIHYDIFNEDFTAKLGECRLGFMELGKQEET